jgi:transporter family protein
MKLIKRLRRKGKMTVFFLSLFGMVCWGIAPIFAKMALKNLNPVVGLIFRTLFAAGVIACWSLASGSLYKIKGVSIYTWILIAIEAVLATLVGDLAYFAAIKKGDVSLVTIIMSSSPLVTLIFACIFLGEKITLTRIIGAILVIIGVILII